MPSAMDRLSLAPPQPPTSLALGLAWVGCVTLLVVALSGLFTWRDTMMDAWPPSTRIYAALGLAPPGGSAPH